MQRKRPAKKKSAAKSKAKSSSTAQNTLHQMMSLAPVENVTRQVEDLAERFIETADDTVDHTRRRAYKLALSLVDFQKTTFDTSFDLLAQVQEQSEKMVHQFLTGSDWLPKEGKDVVDEWVKTLRSGRDEFRRTMDKSFDLITDYFERMESNGSAAGVTRTASKKKSAAKTKTTAKKKSAAKTKTTAKRKTASKTKASAKSSS